MTATFNQMIATILDSAKISAPNKDAVRKIANHYSRHYCITDTELQFLENLFKEA